MSSWNYIRGNIALNITKKTYDCTELTKEQVLDFVNDIKGLFKTNKKYRIFGDHHDWYKEEDIVPYGSEAHMQAFVNYVIDEERECPFDYVYIQLHGNFRDTYEEDAEHMKEYCRNLIKKFNEVAKKHNIYFCYDDIDIKINNKKVKLLEKDYKKIRELED